MRRQPATRPSLWVFLAYEMTNRLLPEVDFPCFKVTLQHASTEYVATATLVICMYPYNATRIGPMRTL